MTTSSIDETYGAIERAYGEGRFQEALARALELQGQLDGSEASALALRLELLLGHIYFYGLRDAASARPHYEQVAQSAPESTLGQLALGSLERCREPSPAALSQASPPADLPAVPWLAQLEDGRQALSALQEAWATVVPAEAAVVPAGSHAVADNGTRDEAATPWAAAPQTEAPLEPRTELEPEPEPEPEPQSSPEPEPALSLNGPDFSQGSLLITLPEGREPEPLEANKKAHPLEGQAHANRNWRAAFSWLRNGGGGSGH
ncbi:MAG: hypothetical protein ACO274_00075 [Vulcanococcus sp.]